MLSTLITGGCDHLTGGCDHLLTASNTKGCFSARVELNFRGLFFHADCLTHKEKYENLTPSKFTNCTVC